MRLDSNLRVLVLILLFAGLTPSVHAGTPKIEPSRSSVEKVPAHGSFQSESRFIGHYGETLSYSSAWVLHAAFLRDGIEVVRFHSPDIRPYPDSPPRAAKDSDFEKVENFAPLKLTQLLVIPHREPDFDLEALRVRKIEELKAQGATFEVQGAPMPVSYWPKNTFQVYVTAPYRLHQLYVESENKLFILTGGLDVEKSGDNFFSVFFAEEFIQSLGRYFERLHRVPFIPPPESFDPLGQFARFVFLPLFAAGLILFGVPWKKQHTRPVAAAALSAAVLGATLHAGGFYLARALSGAGRMELIAPGVIGWMLAPLILGAVYYRSRDLDRPWRWAARTFSALAAFIIVDFGMYAQNLLAVDHAPVAENFSNFMCWVGMLCGACFGLSRGNARKSAGRGMLALAFVLLVANPTAAPAQNLQDELEAKIAVGKRSRDGETYKELATKELKDQRRYFEYQRVEITGIVAADDTNKFARGMFDRILHPSRNDDGSGVERAGFFSTWRRNLFGLPNNARKDISDLFDTKTGKLSPRALEILEPLMDKKNVHVKEIVAHSWGAVLLNVAIREGLINPPEHIIVVGVPDSDLLKWALLAQSTGTKVDIVTSNQDLAVQAAEYADKFRNLDIRGKQRDYNDGKQHESWARWEQNKSNLKITQKGEIHVMRTFGEWDMSNPNGHARNYYYDTLKSEGLMQYTADELAHVQTRKIETRALELMEADIQREIKSIRKRRGLLDEDALNGQVSPQAPPSRPGGPQIYLPGVGWVPDQSAVPAPALAAPPPAARVTSAPPPPLSSVFAGLREFSITACRAPEQLNQTLYIYNVFDLSQRSQDDDQIRNISAGLDECPRRLFNKIIDWARFNNGFMIVDDKWTRNEIGSYSRAPTYSDGHTAPPRGGRENGGTGSGRTGGDETGGTPPPARNHDPEREALRQLKALADDNAMRQRWNLPPRR